MINNPGRVTRSPPQVPAKMSSMTIDHQGVIVPPNAVLRIPYISVFDVAPPQGITDIVILTADLQAVVRFIFGGL